MNLPSAKKSGSSGEHGSEVKGDGRVVNYWIHIHISTNFEPQFNF